MRAESLQQPRDDEVPFAIPELNNRTLARHLPVPPTVPTSLTQSVAPETTNARDNELRWRKLAREQLNPENIQDLAQFLRNTQPPVIVDSSRPKSSRLGSSSRWSMQGLLNAQSKKAKRRKSAPLRVTTDAIGQPHNFVHLSIGERPALVDRQSFSALNRAAKQQLHVSLPPPPIFVEPAWPERRSSMESLRAGKVSGLGSPLPASPKHTSICKSRHSSLSTPSVSDRLSQLSYLKDYGEVLRYLDSGLSRHKVETVDIPAWKTVEQPKIQSQTGTTLSPVTPPVETSTPREPSWEIKKSSTSPQKTSTIRTPPAIPPRTASKFMSPSTEERTPPSSSSSIKPSVVLRTFPPKPKVPQLKPASTTENQVRSPATTSASEHKEVRRPADLKLSKSTSYLDVPKGPPLPESPGLPAMLASMTFPSPPESSTCRISGGTTSSPTDASRSLLATPLSAPTTAQAAGSPSVEALSVWEPSRPVLRSYQSDNGLEKLYARKDEVGRHEEWPLNAATTNVSSNHALCDARIGVTNVSERDTSKEAGSSIVSHELGSSQQKELSDVSGNNLELSTSVQESNPERIVKRSRSRKGDQLRRECHKAASDLPPQANLEEPEQALNTSSNNMETPEDTGRVCPDRTSIAPTPGLRQGTQKPLQNLAERRMARKAKLKEKLTKEARASINGGLKLSNPIISLADAVDSPVLGWFSQNVPEIPRCSPLAHWRSSSTEATINAETGTEKKNEADADVEVISTKLSPIRVRSPGKTNLSKDSPASRTYHSAQSSESSMCSFKTASMHGDWSDNEEAAIDAKRDCDQPSDASIAGHELKTTRESERAQAESPTQRKPSTPSIPEFTFSSIMTVVNLSTLSTPEAQSPRSAQASSPPSPSQLSPTSRNDSSSVKIKRGSTLRPLSLLVQAPPPAITSPAPAASLKRQESLRSDSKPLLRHRPIPIRITKSLPEGDSERISGSPNRKSLPNMLTPPMSPSPRSVASRTSVPPMSYGGLSEHLIEEEPSIGVSLEPHIQTMTFEEENEFLEAHQRETARAWRLAALKERIRLGKATMETELHALESPRSTIFENEEQDDESSKGGASSSSAQGELNDTTNDSQPRSPAPEIRRKSSKRATSGHVSYPSRNKHTRNPAIGCREDMPLEAGKSSDEWMDAIMPLLENMNRMLREMKRDDMDQELGRKVKHLTAAIEDISNEKQDMGR